MRFIATALHLSVRQRRGSVSWAGQIRSSCNGADTSKVCWHIILLGSSWPELLHGQLPSLYTKSRQSLSDLDPVILASQHHSTACFDCSSSP